ncbi:MAG: nitrous oxide reductase family maturation protein NosD [Rhodospirillaceae bacterium]
MAWWCWLFVLGAACSLGLNLTMPPAFAATVIVTVPVTVTVTPGGLQDALLAAGVGDELLLAPGVHPGPVVITKPITLTGQPGAMVDGGGSGQVIRIIAPDVIVRGLSIRDSGISLPDRDAGVFIGKEGDRALIEGNNLEHNLIGVDVWGPHDAIVRNNRISGRTDLRVNERGNGIQLWNSPGSMVIGNDIRFGRDGIFTNVSRGNRFEGNRIRDVRFAVHYMYTQNSTVINNQSIGNDIGYAIMFSDNLIIRGNLSERDNARGMMFNYANSSTIEHNIVRHGGEKCVFIYNSSKNTFLENSFEGCEIGVHFTAGSEQNRISGNAFINNRHQVMYVSTRSLDWSYAGRGNYWSDNPAFDLDGDGIADTAYRPNDLVDQVVWSWPAAKLLLNSPGIQVIRWAQAQFPAIHPGGVIDSRPLMRSPSIPDPIFQLGVSP